MFGKKQKSTDGVSKALAELEAQIQLKDAKIDNLQKRLDYLIEKNKELESLLARHTI